MTRKHIFRAFVLFSVYTVALVPFSETAFAHCDGMDGPVVRAAQKALETGNANLVQVWVQKSDEPEIMRAFRKTLAVRKLGAEARELADMYFFETVVRVHRAGEGAPYTGLKPAGRDLGPAIPAGDKAIVDGSAAPVRKLLTNAVETGLDGHFRHVLSKKEFEQNDVEAGRAYVQAYVVYIHYVERLYQAAAKSASGHYSEGAEIAAHQTHAVGHSPPATHQHKGDTTMNFKIPEPLKREHEELHAELVKATKEPGEVGEAARNVAKLLHPHFVKEEEYALPPLGLLAALAAGEAITDSHGVVTMTERLKAELPEMIAEHQAIVRALKALAEAAKKEGKPQYAHFAEKLTLHAQTEEEVLYPAAILIGEYLKLKPQQ